MIPMPVNYPNHFFSPHSPSVVHSDFFLHSLSLPHPLHCNTGMKIDVQALISICFGMHAASLPSLTIQSFSGLTGLVQSD